MKYLIYRSFGNLDVSIRKHELVGVEYGQDIDDVTEKIVREIEDDMASIPDYKDWSIEVYAPEVVDWNRKVKRYQYVVYAVAKYPVAPKHKRIEYGIIETEGTEPV